MKKRLELWQAALSTLNPNPTDSCPLYLNCATVAALPSRVSRHNSPSAAHFVTRLVRTCLPPGTHRRILMVCERSDVFASACALARAFPLFTHRSGAARRTEKKTVTVEFFLVGQDNGPVEVSTLQCLVNATEGVRLAARIVDTPCNEMNTDTFLEEIKKVGKDLGITPAIIRDEELKTRGFGGDMGGLAAGEWQVDPPTTMPGMKRDCGGAAAILGAFRAAVKQGFKDTLHAVFCLAENAVGPSATRPDDIHLLYSGNLGGFYPLIRPSICPESLSSLELQAELIGNFVWWVTLPVAQPPASCGPPDLWSRHPWEQCLLCAAFHSGRPRAKETWGERATGFGVALLLALFGRASEDPLLNLVSPLGCEADTQAEDMERDSKRRRLV
ncbi:probable aminopeptidase NPEPL1 [Trichechus manatus latirostris]|uniref:Probable aminopeptidase NPEPL1 n=1 Tax=Trichechus manatus latirostris TaxID=127582 RepID=A0A2Y9RQB8_TRIMA|nr:probable aminopeptidase NPEPL1 [Trichechus manatus latirostris]